MKENELLIKLFKNLFDGSPWVDVTIMGTLKNITPENASKKMSANKNSIWEIVNHIINWRLNVLQRVQGKVIVTPANNYFEPVTDNSASAWKKTLTKLEHSQTLWLEFLQDFKKEGFSKIYPNNKMTYYEHVQGIIQHDAYHLGQITLLSKYLQ
jgi:uncharacterized damage-inducible protein DinB